MKKINETIVELIDRTDLRSLIIETIHLTDKYMLSVSTICVTSILNDNRIFITRYLDLKWKIE